MSEQSNPRPRVFITYSWDDEDHKRWVKSFTDRLLSDGINAMVDQYDVSPGERLTQFMEQQITDADYVLVICTPNYKEKADKRTGGVGYEGHIISGEIYAKHNDRKFIPILRRGTRSNAIPTFMSGKYDVDLSNTAIYDEEYKKLLTTLLGIKIKPTCATKATRIAAPVKQPKSSTAQQNEYDPIRILEIIAEEVTVPKMDGSFGSALYAVPFKLSRRPSYQWIELFTMNWDNPPQFSTMHRPGIASVHGDKIILNGTTMEEVRNYHKKTLLLCVDLANESEKRLIEAERVRREIEERRKREHYNAVQAIADEIKFD